MKIETSHTFTTFLINRAACAILENLQLYQIIMKLMKIIFSGHVSTECFDPSLAGTMVPPHTRRAGRYLLGPRLGVSPVKSIVQCLARLENTDQYFQVKLLTIFSGIGRNPREESQDEKQGKVHSL